jgi:hypothetical protein
MPDLWHPTLTARPGRRSPRGPIVDHPSLPVLPEADARHRPLPPRAVQLLEAACPPSLAEPPPKGGLRLRTLMRREVRREVDALAFAENGPDKTAGGRAGRLGVRSISGEAFRLPSASSPAQVQARRCRYAASMASPTPDSVWEGIDWKFGWPTATAFVTALAALISTAITWSSLEQTRLSLRVTTLQSLERQFDGRTMRRARRNAATALLHHQYNEDVGHVLDFFETVGLLVRSNAIEAETAWHTFHYWIDGYGRASEEIRREKWKQHPARWEDFAGLRLQLQKIESRKGESSPTPDDLRDFLIDESELSNSATAPVPAERAARHRDGPPSRALRLGGMKPDAAAIQGKMDSGR